MDALEILPDSYPFTDTKDPIIPKLLHMIWVGEKEAPDYVGKHYDQWKALMPEWTVRLWTNADLHEGEFPPAIVLRIKEAKKGAQKADLMRYFIVYKYGGVYMDADVIPHRSLDPILSVGYPVVLCHDLPITWPYIAIGFFASVPAHPLFKRICAMCYSYVPLNTKDIHMKTGPALFGDNVWHVKDRYVVLPMYSFYRNRTGDIISHGVRRTNDFEGRFGSHTYAATWITDA
jgi:mannosyltransferase OCH1-like enzyme